MDFEQWKDFEKGEWTRQIDVRSFIQKNYTPYEGNSSFLTGTTEKTQKLWNEVLELYKKEHSSQGGVLDIDTDTVSTTGHPNFSPKSFSSISVSFFSLISLLLSATTTGTPSSIN